jgi:hypothetical protein
MKFVWPTSHVGMLHPASARAAGRERTADFRVFAKAAVDGLSYTQTKKLFNIDHAQVETRKSFFEEVGLLFVPHKSDGLVLTAVGAQLYDHLLSSASLEKMVDRDKATSLLAWALSNSQINRPQSPGSPPISEADRKSCDLRPYAAAWQAINDLGGVLYLHEFMGLLRELHKASDYPACIAAIDAGRRLGTIHIDPSLWSSGKPLMNAAIYWKSHLSIAGELLRFDNDDQAFRFVEGRAPVIQAVLDLQRGCGGSKATAMTARTWNTVYDYYDDVGGRECPPFVASGAPVALDVNGLKITMLKGYELRSGKPAYIDGGPELCSLLINTPCFHIDQPKAILRLASKAEIPGGGVRVTLEPGRPIVNGTLLFNHWGATTDAD